MKYKTIAGAFLKRKLALVSLMFLIIVVIIGIVAPWIAPNDPNKVELAFKLQGPGGKFLLGTDHLGRCVLSRLIYGTRTSLGAAFFVMIFSMIIGTMIGSFSAYKGGKIDNCIMRICDTLLSFPSLIIVLVIVGALGPGLKNVIIGMVMVQWLWYVRIVRSLVLSIKAHPFIDAARTSGTSNISIIFKHIMPNLIPQLIVIATMDLGSTILHFAGYSFLGLSIQPPTPEWSVMIEDGSRFIRSKPELMYYPGILIIFVVISLNMIGDVFRDIFDEIHI